MKDYDPNKPNRFIQYLDANNLYGWAHHKDYQLMVLNGYLKINFLKRFK